MKPVKFPQMSVELERPPGMTESECQPLPVFRGKLDGRGYCLSCWEPTWRERLSILFFGKVWVYCISGFTQPPIALLGTRDAFKEIYFQGVEEK